MPETNPFHESNYQEHEKSKILCPLFEVKIGVSKKSTMVLADTGCDVGLAILIDQIGELDLGQKISADPYDIGVADGHVIKADIYKADINLNGITKSAVIYVLNPSTFKNDTEEKAPIAYLGRGFLDNFNVVFKGKEQKVAFFHP